MGYNCDVKENLFLHLCLQESRRAYGTLNPLES